MYKSTKIERLLFTPEKRILVGLIDIIVLAFLLSGFVYFSIGNPNYSKLAPDEIISSFVGLLLAFFILVLFIAIIISSFNIKLNVYYINKDDNEKLYIIKRVNKDQVLLSEFHYPFFNKAPDFYLFQSYEDVVKEKIQIERLTLKDNFSFLNKNSAKRNTLKSNSTTHHIL